MKQYLIIFISYSLLLSGSINAEFIAPEDIYDIETTKGTISYNIKTFIQSKENINELPHFDMKYGDINVDNNEDYKGQLIFPNKIQFFSKPFSFI